MTLALLPLPVLGAKDEPLFPKCNICGKGTKLAVTVPELAPIPSSPGTTCADFQEMGDHGDIPPELCLALHELVAEPCACGDINPSTGDSIKKPPMQTSSGTGCNICSHPGYILDPDLDYDTSLCLSLVHAGEDESIPPLACAELQRHAVEMGCVCVPSTTTTTTDNVTEAEESVQGQKTDDSSAIATDSVCSICEQAGYILDPELDYDTSLCLSLVHAGEEENIPPAACAGLKRQAAEMGCICVPADTSTSPGNTIEEPDDEEEGEEPVTEQEDTATEDAPCNICSKPGYYVDGSVHDNFSTCVSLAEVAAQQDIPASLCSDLQDYAIALECHCAPKVGEDEADDTSTDTPSDVPSQTPTMAPSLLDPFGAADIQECNLCGDDNLIMGNTDAIPLPGGSTTTCGDFLDRASAGLIPPDVCSGLVRFTRAACECQVGRPGQTSCTALLKSCVDETDCCDPRAVCMGICVFPRVSDEVSKGGAPKLSEFDVEVASRLHRAGGLRHTLRGL